MTDKAVASAPNQGFSDEPTTPMTVEDLQQLARDGASRAVDEMRKAEEARKAKRRLWVESLALLPDLDKRVNAAVMKAAAAGQFECPLLIVNPPSDALPYPDCKEYRLTTSVWRGMKVAQPRRKSWLSAFRSPYTYHNVRSHLFAVVDDHELRDMLIDALVKHNVAGVDGIQYEWRTWRHAGYRHNVNSLHAVWK